MPKTDKPSPVEVIKEESDYLRGRISEELVDGKDEFGKESIQLLKHHGTYQQDDRDLRAAARAAGQGKAYMFMVRTRIPGGKLTSSQLLAEIGLCDELGNNTLRITSRQGLQLHGIVKEDLQATIERINRTQLTTLGACGDVNRNVMCCPAPYANRIHNELQRTADQIAEHLAPRTTAYHEIWLTWMAKKSNWSPVAPTDMRSSPFMGDTTCRENSRPPIALPHDNCVDIYTHDLGFLALTDGDKVIGYNVLVGGGFGMTPSAKKTFPALAQKLCRITPDQVLDVATAVVQVQRDFGNRADRKVARLKYLIADWGIERFKSKVDEYFGSTLPAATEDDISGIKDHLGWEEQGDGNWYYGLNVENGRILDNEKMQLKSALTEICSTLQPNLRLTAHQSLLFCDIKAEDKHVLQETLRRHHVPLSEQISNARRWSMACVAWPTCGLSITESERALPEMIDQLEAELAKLGLEDAQFNLRMTGCPNGCVRPYNPDIGLVGKAKEKYTIYLGGRQEGNRLSFIYKDLVPAEEVVSELITVFRYFKQDRLAGESFGDFCYRKGLEDLLEWAEQGQ